MPNWGLIAAGSALVGLGAVVPVYTINNWSTKELPSWDAYYDETSGTCYIGLWGCLVSLDGAWNVVWNTWPGPGPIPGLIRYVPFALIAVGALFIILGFTGGML